MSQNFCSLGFLGLTPQSSSYYLLSYDFDFGYCKCYSSEGKGILSFANQATPVLQLWRDRFPDCGKPGYPCGCYSSGGKELGGWLPLLR